MQRPHRQGGYHRGNPCAGQPDDENYGFKRKNRPAGFHRHARAHRRLRICVRSGRPAGRRLDEGTHRTLQSLYRRARRTRRHVGHGPRLRPERIRRRGGFSDVEGFEHHFGEASGFADPHLRSHRYRQRYGARSDRRGPRHVYPGRQLRQIRRRDAQRRHPGSIARMV